MNLRHHFTFTFLAVFAILQLPCLSTAVTMGNGPVEIEQPDGMIKLVGTAVADRSEKSLAVVEIDGRDQIYLREGDGIDGVLVKQILRDRIIVDAGHGEESVRLRQSLSVGTKTRTEATHPTTSFQSFGPRPPEDRNLEVVYLDRESKKSLLGNIDGALKDVQFDPVSVYGRAKGFRISPVEAGSVFSETGLKTGDIIREVNGKLVTGAYEAAALFKQFAGGGEFDIEVKGRRTRQIYLIVE